MKQPPNWIIVLTFAPVVTAIIGFLFFMLFDRDKLQSETYQIRKLELEMVQQKGGLAIPAIDIQLISNPERPALPPLNEEEQP